MIRPHPHDLLAGLTVAVVLVPQSLAYAQLAGMPAWRGLLASAAPPIIAALLASSAHLQTGPTALTALLTFGALSTIAPVGSDRYVLLAALLALLVGLVRIAVGTFRLGAIAFMMSGPVLLGFVPGAAIVIIASQLPAALGVRVTDTGPFGQVTTVLAHADRSDAATVALAASAAAVTAFGPRLSKRVPWVLLVVAATMLVAGLTGFTGAVIGRIPVHAPTLSLAFPWHDLPTLVVPGIVIALVGFAEPAAVARALAAQDRVPWDASREFVSQGAANVAAAVTGAFPVGGSFSRSALSHAAGARTRWSGAVTGLAVLAFLPAAGLLEQLPRGVLAGIVIGTVARLVRLRPIIALAGRSRPQLALACGTLAATVALAPHVERAVLSAVGAAIVIHLWREFQIDVNLAVDGDMLTVAPSGILWFGTAAGFEDRLLAAVAATPAVRRVRVSLAGVGRVDMTAALTLADVRDTLALSGVALDLVDVPRQAERLLG